MITFIAEAKPKTQKHNATNVQNGLDDLKRVNAAVNETVPQQVSQPPRIPAWAISQSPSLATASNAERRMSQERLPVSVNVSLFHNDEYIALGTICNVGGRGMFVETSAAWIEGALLQLCFTAKTNSRSTHHRIDGRVAHITGEGIGVHLDVLKRDTLTGLQALKKQAGRERRSKATA